MKSNTGGIREKIDNGVKKRKDDIIKEINAEKIAKETDIEKHKRERYAKTDDIVKEIEAKAKEAVDNANKLEKAMGVNFEDSAKAIADQVNHPRVDDEMPKQQGNPGEEDQTSGAAQKLNRESSIQAQTKVNSQTQIQEEKEAREANEAER